MFGFIEKIRSKPESVRKKLLLVSVSLLMLIVVFVWFSNLNSIFTSSSAEDKVASSYKSPVTILKEKFSYFSNMISGELNFERSQESM